MDPKQFASRYFEDYKISDDEIIVKYCPFCHGGKRRDRNSFCLNSRKCVYICFSCGRRGTFRQLRQELTKLRPTYGLKY